MLKYAASVGILIKEVHLVDAVHVVDETSTTLTSGVIFDVFHMIEVLEMSRWDQHLKQKDYQSILKLVLCSNSIKKACLHFPSEPPDMEKEVLGDLVIYDKTVEWIIGPKLVQALNMETFKWEVTVHTSDVHTTALKQISPAEVAAQVEWDYEAKEADELTIKVGDIITHITLTEDGWWVGEVNGKRGIFPCNYVKITLVNPFKPAARKRGVFGPVDTGRIQTDKNASTKEKLLARVIARYDPQEDDELSLEVNEQIEVTKQSQQWWWEGIANGKKGMFPSNYVILLPKKKEMEQQDDETPVEAQVVYGYDAVKPDELTIKVGDIITDISVVDDRWWKGVVNEKEGMFPSNCVMVCKGTSEHSTQSKKALAKVCFSHTPQGEDELFLIEDDIIEIISQPDPWWWEGIVKGKKGYFPSYCVDLLRKDEEREPEQERKDRERELRKYTKPVLAQVVYDYDAIEPDELTIKGGDTITDIDMGVGGWCEGVVNGKRGRFPSSFVEFHMKQPQPSSQNKNVLAKVISSFTPQSGQEVSLVEGDIIDVTSQQDPFWWEGVANGKQGNFPSHCVLLIPEDGEERKQQHYVSPDSRGKSILSAETMISNDGGLLQIQNTDIKLIIPPDALGKNKGQCLVRMRVIPPGSHAAVPSSFSSHSSTVLELLPNNLRFQQPVELTLPHCLKLKKDAEYKAKIFMSHHDGDIEPRWEEVTNHHYILRDTACTLWLNHFCWTKYEIDDEIVEAKRIQVYTAAKPICVPDDIAEIEVGYHLDLPGAGEILRLNPSLIIGQRRPFLFLREGSHPLSVSLQKIRPVSWKYSTPDENPKEISFRSVASSIEYSCPFLLEQDTENCNIPTCIFKASQNQNDLQLLIRPKLDEDSKHSEESLYKKESSLHMTHDSVGKESAVYRRRDKKDYDSIGDKGAYQTLEPHLHSNQTHQRQQTERIHQRQLRQYSGQQPERNHLHIQEYHYSQHFNMMPIPAGTFGGHYGPHEPPWYSESDAQGVNVINYNTLISIARKLDPPDVLHNDWRMLAGELGFTVEDIAMFERNGSPTYSVITCALRRSKLTSCEHLKSILTKMNRKDAADCLSD